MNTIKFLGTAGARFVVIKQLRSSGGIWLTLDDKTLLIDPGPGTLVRCASSRPKLNPAKLDGIILTHRHLDHAGDLNIMIEAMTEGGFKKRGVLYAPADALDNDPVVLKYLRDFVERIEILREGGKYKLGDISWETPIRNIHGVETYGLKFKIPSGGSLSFVSDTRYFPELEKAYSADIVVLNVVLYQSFKGRIIDHLTVEDAGKILQSIQPKLGILSHFGMTMLRAKPWVIADEIKERLGVPVIAARDGMSMELDKYL